MGELLQFVTSLHKSTKRDYLGRMTDSKVDCMGVAKSYGSAYWDGDRRFGYGGYRYIPGRWRKVAEDLVQRYSLSEQSKVLDIGCGKGFLLHEMKELLPGLSVVGFDASQYALSNSKKEVHDYLFLHNAEDKIPYSDKSFDLAFSLGCLHNLKLPDLWISLQEMERVAKNGYLMVESYRNDQELFNLQCWALTAETIVDVKAWEWIFKNAGYSGDYEFILFE
ncbi:MAG: methyltransferase domain-containing protein [bacterium]|jgi:SAM-dependent methyltransferase